MTIISKIPAKFQMVVDASLDFSFAGNGVVGDEGLYVPQKINKSQT